MAQETGQQLGDVGTTTARPPWVSVPMGVLGRPPVRAGQALLDPRPPPRAGRATSSGRATGAAPTTTATRRPRRWPSTSAAGLIDVSTLGKLLVRGPDAGEFLDRLYPNRFSNLEPGRIRYGVISSDAGPDRRRRHDLPARRRDVLRDDDLERRRRGRGVVLVVAGRLAACDVHLTDVTQGLAGGQPRRARGRARSWPASPTWTAPTRRSSTSTASRRRSPACRA